MSTIEDLTQLLDLAEKHDKGLYDRLKPGFNTYLTFGDRLDESWGLTGVDKKSARTTYLYTKRDTHLAQAHQHCEGATPWKQSQELRRQLSRFGDVWHRFRDLDEPPGNFSNLRHHLFYAVKTGLPLPTTARQLHNIFVKSRPV